MAKRPKGRRRKRLAAFVVVTFVAGAFGGMLAMELREGRLQAWVWTQLAAGAEHWVEPGPSDDIRYPETGPYDERLGYIRLPEFTHRLTASGGAVEAQARWSKRLVELADAGIFPLFHEKDSAGLRLVDRGGQTVFDAAAARATYADYDAIPKAVAASLVYIENRELLDTDQPLRNPAVEWKRIAKAVGQAGIRVFKPSQKVPGGSTLATQMEKFRHSAGGRTRGARDKLMQMASASMRAYMGGPDTTESRHRILLGYLNSVPLGAVRGVGEVHGFGNGLHAWFGADFGRVNRRLRRAATIGSDDSALAARAMAYRQTLALLIGLRRPRHFFRDDRRALESAIDFYARQLAKEKVISPALRDATLATRLVFRNTAEPLAPLNLDQKGTDSVRLGLLETLGIERLYDLDRLDLTVHTTLDARAQIEVTQALQALKNPGDAEAAGVLGRGLLRAKDLDQVQYSFALYERVGGTTRVRINTDTRPGPFSLNDGMKLELGSTAKLRTLITYLELIAEIDARLEETGGKPARPDRRDALSAWVNRWRRRHPDADRTALMEAALERKYSANPNEKFFTGGGLHVFGNFAPVKGSPTVRKSLAQSVNLPFVRMMRDIVHHLTYRDGKARAILEDSRHPRRLDYLRRYADQDGAAYLSRFHARHVGQTAQQSLNALADRIAPAPKKLTVLFRTIRPQASVRELAGFLTEWTGDAHDVVTAIGLYETAEPGVHNLQDLGYLAGLHPLEMWTVRWLAEQPKGRLKSLQADAAGNISDAYAWLLKGRRTRSQTHRIRTMLEQDAYLEIHRRWARLGYPFERLVPSFGSALGSSGDRPSALAELVGVLSAGGLRTPPQRITRYHFAAETPYETAIAPPVPATQRVLPPEVAAAALSAMRGVVTHGTGRRLDGAFGGGQLSVRAKTGTGDNRRRQLDRRGRVVSESVNNRTAAVVFTIGERWFGAVTAYVPGEAAAEHRFTSALPSQILRALAPKLLPVFGRSPESAELGAHAAR